MHLAFDEASHTYTWKSQPIPSLSSILEAAGLTAHLARIPRAILERKAAIGEELHAAAALIFDGAEQEEIDVDPAVVPYFEALKSFLNSGRWRYERCEAIRSGSIRGMRWGCRVDGLGLLDGEPTILELKTSLEPSPSWPIQLAGQWLTLRKPKDWPCWRRVVVQLKKDGSYKLYEFNDDAADRRMFVAALTLAWWKLGQKKPKPVMV
jgi:hypothetical protein